MPADSAPALAAAFDPSEEAVVRAAIARDLGTRYRVQGYLGRGASATVWRAHDCVTDQTVAVKRCPVAAGHPRSYYRELRTMFRLAHPRIVRIINLLETAPQARYLILEFCGGGSLRPILQAARGRPPDYAFAASLVRQVAEALAEAHRWGVAHRDLKPENILFDAPVTAPCTASVKLADFGLARTLQQQPQTDAPLRALSGTPAYMAPEQFQGACVAASDLYALGAVLFELLHGRPLFQGTAEELAQQHVHAPPAFDPALPRPWPAVLAALLDKTPERRPTASDLLAQLPDRPPPRRREAALTPQRETTVPAATFALHALGAGCAAVATDGVSVLDFQGSVRQFLPLVDVTASAGADGLWLAQQRNLWHLDADGRLAVVSRLEQAPELLCAGDDRLALCAGNELVEHDATGTDVNPLWRRQRSDCGLRPFLARRSDGLLALAEGPRPPRLTLLDRSGRTVQRVALPGLCWGLQAGPADTLLAALLVNGTLTWHRVDPRTCQCTPLVDSSEVIGFVPLRQDRIQGISAAGVVHVWDWAGTLLDHWCLDIGAARCRAAVQVDSTLAVLLSTADGKRVRFFQPRHEPAY